MGKKKASKTKSSPAVKSKDPMEVLTSYSPLFPAEITFTEDAIEEQMAAVEDIEMSLVEDGDGKPDEGSSDMNLDGSADEGNLASSGSGQAAGSVEVVKNPEGVAEEQSSTKEQRTAHISTPPSPPAAADDMGAGSKGDPGSGSGKQAQSGPEAESTGSRKNEGSKDVSQGSYSTQGLNSPGGTLKSQPAVAGEEAGSKAGAWSGGGRQGMASRVDTWRPVVKEMLEGPSPKAKETPARLRRRIPLDDSSDEDSTVLDSPAFRRGSHISQAAAAARGSGSKVPRSFYRASSDDEDSIPSKGVVVSKEVGEGAGGAGEPKEAIKRRHMRKSHAQPSPVEYPMPFGPQPNEGEGEGSASSEGDDAQHMKTRKNSHKLFSPSVYVPWPAKAERSRALRSPQAMRSTSTAQRVADVLDGSDPEEARVEPPPVGIKSPFECALADKVFQMGIASSSSSDEEVVNKALKAQVENRVNRRYDLAYKREVRSIMYSSSDGD